MDGLRSRCFMTKSTMSLNSSSVSFLGDATLWISLLVAGLQTLNRLLSAGLHLQLCLMPVTAQSAQYKKSKSFEYWRTLDLLHRRRNQGGKGGTCPPKICTWGTSMSRSHNWNLWDTSVVFRKNGKVFPSYVDGMAFTAEKSKEWTNCKVMLSLIIRVPVYFLTC